MHSEQRSRPRAAGLLAVICAALLIRLAVSLHPYSGKGDVPQYGDFEAQRHWMELTINIPVLDWYRNTNDNTLGYWGIDYPPLTAYQSWLYGKVIHAWEPEAVTLLSSRGYENDSSKLLMRLSVVASDLLVLFPAAVAAVHVFGNDRSPQQRHWALAAVLLQPAALLIDHGHFQYNNLSLGFAAGAAAAIGAGWQMLGSFLFCLALNHKQMTLYYAPAFFAHLLGLCLQQKGVPRKVWTVAKLGLVVVATFALVWAPYLRSMDSALGVLQRLAPLRRGLFEDYVANFWCVSSLAVKWKRLLSQQALVRITASATLAAALPSMVEQLRRPTKKGLLYCMANSAWAFYLFSYQVHEKSVLLPLLPVTLLALEEPFLASWLPAAATFSMYPLLKKDGLSLAYAAALLLWAASTIQLPSSHKSDPHAAKAKEPSGIWSWGAIGGVIIGCGLHAGALAIKPPARLPFLHDALFVSCSFLLFASAALYLNVRQWQLGGWLSERRTE